jgi:hypothetical protein
MANVSGVPYPGIRISTRLPVSQSWVLRLEFSVADICELTLPPNRRQPGIFSIADAQFAVRSKPVTHMELHGFGVQLATSMPQPIPEEPNLKG